MRYLTIAVAIVLGLAVLRPADVAAKGPNSGNNSNSGNSGNSGMNNNSNWNNSNWKWNSHPYYHDYDYYYYSAQRPIFENPLFSGLPIKIVNPASNNVTLNYTLNGTIYPIPPGFSQTLVADRLWTIQFSRGAGFGDARYGLESGLYTFGSSDHGWELYHKPLVDSVPLGGSLNPTPPQSAPINPSPGAATVPQPH
jgi:hypothetical protein